MSNFTSLHPSFSTRAIGKLLIRDVRALITRRPFAAFRACILRFISIIEHFISSTIAELVQSINVARLAKQTAQKVSDQSRAAFNEQ